MKKLFKLLMVLTIVIASTQVNAQDSKFTNEMSSLLSGQIPFEIKANDTIHAKAYLKFNNNKIIDVNVKSIDSGIVGYIKKRLRNKDLKSRTFDNDSLYLVPIKLIVNED